jgi:hypothetical protein
VACKKGETYLVEEMIELAVGGYKPLTETKDLSLFASGPVLSLLNGASIFIAYFAMTHLKGSVLML